MQILQKTSYLYNKITLWMLHNNQHLNQIILFIQYCLLFSYTVKLL